MESWFTSLLGGSPDIAQSFASAGVPPPPLPPLGESLAGPLPQEGFYGGSPETNPNLRPIGGPASPSTPGRNPLVDTLRGVSAPAAPKPPEVGTPAAPRPTGRIEGGQLLQLMNLLNPGARAPAPVLPQSLLAAIGGGR